MPTICDYSISKKIHSSINDHIIIIITYFVD